jgi:ATP-dependent Clp protease ATP-binding subunit ClpC
LRPTNEFRILNPAFREATVVNGHNFTGRVRQSLMRARQESVSLRHAYVGTEHILLGLLGEPDSVAAAVMSNAGLDASSVRAAVLAVVKPGPDATDSGRAGALKSVTAAMGLSDRSPDIPYTSRAKKALELAILEARELGHARVGTEHLLLGLLREEKGIAAQVCHTLGLTIEAARADALAILGDTPGGEFVDDRAVRVTVVMERSGGELEARKFASPSEAARFLRHLES